LIVRQRETQLTAVPERRVGDGIISRNAWADTEWSRFSERRVMERAFCAGCHGPSLRAIAESPRRRSPAVEGTFGAAGTCSEMW
jgi:hypothetical protein